MAKAILRDFCRFNILALTICIASMGMLDIILNSSALVVYVAGFVLTNDPGIITSGSNNDGPISAYRKQKVRPMILAAPKLCMEKAS